MLKYALGFCLACAIGICVLKYDKIFRPFLVNATTQQQQRANAAGVGVEVAAKWNTLHGHKLVPRGSPLPSWGSLRPGIYFGLKSRTSPSALATGLLWSANGLHSGFRHDTSQDELEQFQWLEHDGRFYGLEQMIDKAHGIAINASFVIGDKEEDEEENTKKKERSDNSLIWAQRVLVQPLAAPQYLSSTPSTNLLLYFGIESSDTSRAGVEQGLLAAGVKNLHVVSSVSNKIVLSGESLLSGAFRLSVTLRRSLGSQEEVADEKAVEECVAGGGMDCPASSASAEKSVGGLSYYGRAGVDIAGGVSKLQQDARGAMFQSKGRATMPLKSAQLPENVFSESLDLRGAMEPAATFVAFQAMVPIGQPFALDVVMQSSSDSEVGTQALDELFASRSLAFHQRFDSTFQLASKLVLDEDEKMASSSATPVVGGGVLVAGSREFTDSDVLAAKAALSSVLGGMAYLHGKPQIAPAIDVEKQQQEGPSAPLVIPDPYPMTQIEAISLFTATPSRTAFPRGFLWDEGFHQLIISQWDSSIAMHALASWLNAMYKCDINAPLQGIEGGEDEKVVDGDSEEEEDEKEGEALTETARTAAKSAIRAKAILKKLAASTCIGGWIPREMILGDDARKRVPDEFMTQRENIANPPTLLLVVESLYKKATSQDTPSDEKHIILSFLRDAYPALEQWINWLLHSQRGLVSGSFRWRGRSISDQKVLPNTLASGLDDYPRGPFPVVEERHVDLHCWMARSCDIMSALHDTLRLEDHGFVLPDAAGAISNKKKQDQERAAKAEKDREENQFSHLGSFLQTQLEPLHWSDVLKTFADVGVAGNKDRIVSEVLCRCGNPVDKTAVDIYLPVSKMNKNDQEPPCPAAFPQLMYPHSDGQGGYKLRERYVMDGDFALQYIAHLGYNSLFPLLLRVLPASSPRLAPLLDLLEAPSHLWSGHGLRSMSTNTTFYRRRNAPGDAPYWRGPIWININYLALGALRHYAQVLPLEDPQKVRCASLYRRLRRDVTRLVLGEYHRTGHFWEQYDDQQGVGIRGHPFTGWTALILNIMAENFD